MMKFVFGISKLLSAKSNNINQNIMHKLIWQQLRNYDTESNSKKKDIASIKAKRRLWNEPRIKLIYSNKSVSVTTLEEAEKIALSQNCCLVPMSEKFKHGITYKLVSLATEIPKKDLENNTKNKSATKSIKTFTIKSNIANHDLMVKINNVNRLLKKGYNVKILLNHPEGIKPELLENIKKNVQGTLLSEQLKNGITIVQYTTLLDNTKISEEDDNK